MTNVPACRSKQVAQCEGDRCKQWQRCLALYLVFTYLVDLSEMSVIVVSAVSVLLYQKEQLNRSRQQLRSELN